MAPPLGVVPSTPRPAPPAGAEPTSLRPPPPQPTTGSAPVPLPTNATPPRPAPVPNTEDQKNQQTPSQNLPSWGQAIPLSTKKSENIEVDGLENGMPNETGQPLMCLRCGGSDHYRNYCKAKMVYCKHCKTQKHVSHCCAFIPKATSTSNGGTLDTGSNSSKQTWQNPSPNPPHKQKKPKKPKQLQHTDT